VTLGCKTKNAKIVGLSIAALQRLVPLGIVPLASLPNVLTTLGSVAGQAVEIQLKILQTLLSILTYCKDMNGDVLGTAFLLCFKLQDSRVGVVSSTAAATLRQAIMVVFDRVTVDAAEPTIELELPSDPPQTIKVTPAALDAYTILSDLCLLTAPQTSSGLSLWPSAEKEKPRMLKLTTLQRTFGLELIESILSGYEGIVKLHPELLFLLQHKLHPLIIRLQTEKPSFPVALRICRLIYVLIRHYSDKMSAEVEMYITSLIRMGVGELADDEKKEKDGKKEPKRDGVAPYLHVLALEILRGISSDPVVLRAIWTQYDKAGGPKLFAKIVSAFGHLVNEKPTHLGVSSQIYGLDVPPTALASNQAGYFDMGIGMVASAASVGVSAVGAMVGSGQGGGLGFHSTMKQRLIEQHDKTEAPPVPETYIYLLAVQALDAIAESIVAGIADEATRDVSRGMAETAWPPLLASLSYIISTNLSDQLFAEVLTALQGFTIALGNLNLNTPRDAFLNTLARYAVPHAVVSAMQSYTDAPTPRTGTVTELSLTALGVGPTGPPSLSERNLACLRSLISAAQVLAPTLGPGWHDVLETLQNANYLLSASRGKQLNKRQVSISGMPPSNGGSARASVDLPRPEMLQNVGPDTIQAAVNNLFERSVELDDEAFTVFITALCRLSAEMIGMDPERAINDAASPNPNAGSPPRLTASPMVPPSSSPIEGRRRTSGIAISQSIKSGERSFGLAKLRAVATINLSRMVRSETSTAWTAVMQHLLGVARHGSAPSTIRMQASDTLGELILASLRAEHDARTQRQVFDVLASQVDVNPVSQTVATDYDVRAAGYQTLNQILQSWGHSLEVGWPPIFGMLNSVCQHPGPNDAGRSPVHRGNANLVRIAFPSLTLICTDFLSSLDASAMRMCILCLGQYGQQQDDVNITLAAVGLLWSVSDAVQGDSKELWLYLLTVLLKLAADTRLEVRSSSMQTLFRCIELYGGSLSPQLWVDVFDQVIFPLLQDMRGDESQVLALTSVGSIFGAFLNQIASLPSSQSIYARLLERLKKSFISAPRPCSTAALKVLDRVLTETRPGSPFLVPTWDAFVIMGEAVPTGEPYTQDNLLSLTRVAAKLHDQLEWDDARVRHLSSILRSVVEYSCSNDYRPDVDVMSPLQEAVAKLIAKSPHFGPSVVLSDLAEFGSLAYMGETGGKVTYVALSKFAMPRMADVFAKVSEDVALYNDGTVESVLGAYALPIKLKYDCPPASRFGSDPPLWRTALSTFVRVLDLVMPGLARNVEPVRYTAIWAQVMDVYAGVLLADGEDSADDEAFVIPILDQIRSAVHAGLHDARVPDHVVAQHAETLRRASGLYHYDVRAAGGTTAPVVAENREATRYWALNQLIVCSSKGKTNSESDDENAARVAALFVPTALRRFEDTLASFLNDAKLRGQMPVSK
jgi:hypothetical protein